MLKIKNLPLALGSLIFCATYANAQQQYQTYEAKNITSTSAELYGGIWTNASRNYLSKFTGNGFNWGTTYKYGQDTASTETGIVTGYGGSTKEFDGKLTGLKCNTLYYYSFSGIYHGTNGREFPGNGAAQNFTTAPCTPSPVAGFTGKFAPAMWQTGSNAPINLINTSSAPNSITLNNYSEWDVSGADIIYPRAPVGGTVSFSYSIPNGTELCPASYKKGDEWVLLPKGSSTVTFPVAEGESFGFALNGENKPNDFGCQAGGASISVTISDFVFSPSSDIAMD